MVRNSVAVTVLGVLFLFVGCSGYHDLPRPWNSEPTEDEFGSSNVVRVGDKLRITTEDNLVSEGLLVEFDQQFLTLVLESAEPRNLLIPTDKISRLEVFQMGSTVELSKVALVAAASSIVYLVIKASSGPTFSPDYESTGKLYGQ